jgi:hypothetical protein
MAYGEEGEGKREGEEKMKRGGKSGREGEVDSPCRCKNLAIHPCIQQEMLHSSLATASRQPLHGDTKFTPTSITLMTTLLIEIIAAAAADIVMYSAIFQYNFDASRYINTY